MKINSDPSLSAPASELATIASQYNGLYSGSDSAYKLAFSDFDFLNSPEMRGVRMQLEISKPEIAFLKHGIKHSITVFGSARFKSREQALNLLSSAQSTEEIQSAERFLKTSIHYEHAYQFGKIVGQFNISRPQNERFIIATGGGPGVMEAANRGSFEVGSPTAGFNIALPFEQEPNPYITPSLCFQFAYFSARKFSLLASGSSTPGKTLIPGGGFKNDYTTEGGGSVAIVVFAGGIGSLDELFEIFCLIQCKKMRPRPLILVGREYWSNVFNLEYLVDQGAICPQDLDLLTIVDSAEEAWSNILKFYALSSD